MSLPTSGTPHEVRRILLVEDNEDVREMIRVFLEAYDLEVSEAEDGPSGLARALEEKPDLVLMDLGLPGSDGLSVASAIRAADPRPSLRIYAMSGYGADQFVARAESQAIDRWLLKPVSPDALLLAIRGA